MSFNRVNTKGLRTDLSRLLHAGQRTEVLTYRTPYAGLVGMTDALHLDPPASSVSLSDVRKSLKGFLDRAHAGEVIRLTNHERVEGALVPLQVLYTLPPPDVALSAQDKESNMEKEPIVITIWNEAGGAGKSTLVAELGALLAGRKRSDGQPYQILLLDQDPQRTLTHRMGLSGGENNPAERLGRSINNVLQDAESELPEPFMATEMPDLKVIPGHPSLNYLQGRISAERSFLNLRQVLRRDARAYDFVLIDTPPSNGDLTKSAIVAADFVVMPIPTHIKGVENLPNVQKVMAECQQFGDVRLLAFVPMSYDKNRQQDRAIMEVLSEDYRELAPSTRPLVERSGVYRNVIPARSAVVRMYPRDKATVELNEVADQLLELMGVSA